MLGSPSASSSASISTGWGRPAEGGTAGFGDSALSELRALWTYGGLVPFWGCWSFPLSQRGSTSSSHPRLAKQYSPTFVRKSYVWVDKLFLFYFCSKRVKMAGGFSELIPLYLRSSILSHFLRKQKQRPQTQLEKQGGKKNTA